MTKLVPILQVKNIKKSYNKRIILNNISFNLYPNSFVYLIGKNGTGKSTTLNLIRGESVLNKGSIQMGNYNYLKLKKKNLPYLRRNIGYIFQDSKLIENRTVEENLAYPLEALSLSDDVIAERCHDILKLTQLYDFRHSLIKNLSGGEKRKVAIARAIINKPELLLADEPTASLDKQTVDDIMLILNKINKTGTAILMVTHNEQILRKYPHTIMQLKDHQLNNVKLV